MSHFGTVIQEYEGQSFGAYFSAPVRRLCQEQDEMWGNLEGPLSRSDDGLQLQLQMLNKHPSWPKLFFPRHYIPALLNLNYQVLGIANNHSFDFETASDTETTAEVLSDFGVAAPGLNFEPIIREVGGLSFAIIATTSFLNPPVIEGPVALITDENKGQLMAQVRQWSRRVDYLVVMTHWGWDYVAAPMRAVRELARELLAAGAKVIYGNHPHILWPIEQPAPDQLVCYSMGNFAQVFGCGRAHRNFRPYSKALYGGMLSVKFTRERISPTFYPLLTKHNYEEWLKELGLRKSYWYWTSQEIRYWKETIARRQTRFFSSLEFNGAPRAIPLTMNEIDASYPWNSGIAQEERPALARA